MDASPPDPDASSTPYPELELLLAGARSKLDEAAERRVREILERGVDESRFWRLAADHCVEPLVYLNLAERAEGCFSRESLADAKLRFERGSNRTLAFTRELLRVLEVLEEGGVRGVPYKGPLLAEAAYGNLLARTFHDLDVAVRTADREKARELLLAAGYRDLHPPAAAEDASAIWDSHECELCTDDGKIAIELHWLFSPRHRPFGLRPEDLWDRLERKKLMGQEVWSFDADALVCLLAAHGSSHQWMRLDWIASVAEHVRAHPDLDWPGIVEKARASGMLRNTRLALLLAAELLGAPVPARVLAEARAERSVPRLVELTRRRLRRGPAAGLAPGEWLAYELASRERLRDRWPYFRHHLRDAWAGPADAGGGGEARGGRRGPRLLRRLAGSRSRSLAWRLLRG